MTFMQFLYTYDWPTNFFIIYIFSFLFFRYKDFKEFKRLVSEAAANHYTNREIVETFTAHIKKHPLSLFNSNIRIKLIPSVIACREKDLLKQIIKKIRMMDVHRQLEDVVFYSLFLLKEYGNEDEFQLLKKKIIKSFKKYSKEQYGFLLSGNLKALPAINTGSPRYLQGVASYYSGIEFLKIGDTETAYDHFKKAKETIDEKAFYDLLILKGYFHEKK